MSKNSSAIFTLNDCFDGFCFAILGKSNMIKTILAVVNSNIPFFFSLN